MRRLVALCLTLGASCLVPAVALATPPQIVPSCVGYSSCDRWFTSDVRLRWVISGGDPILGCQEILIRDDTPPQGRRYDCTARQTDPPNDEASAYVTIFRDATPPVIADAVSDRPPDHAGWYTHPVTFSGAGMDATSGLRTCDKVTYAGPDNAAATIVITCRDLVGNVASRAFPLRYDATPPDPSTATVDSGDRVVRLRWPSAASVSVVRTPGLDGQPTSVLTPAADGLTDVRVRNGVAYRYVVTLADEAGNAASRELVVVPAPRLLSPDKRALVNAPPVLRWTPVRGARYYNVQLFRDGRKILSAWPKRPQLRLRERWRFHGRRHRLINGRYQWYVWPGEGPRSAHRYGKRIGARSFVLER
jgi:hypothetical protein